MIFYKIQIYHYRISFYVVRCYADDIVIVARGKNILEEMYFKLKKEVGYMGLVGNYRKTKNMKVSATEERKTLSFFKRLCF